MTNMERKTFCAALSRYGAQAQITMAFEEMAELQDVLCKFLRGRVDGDTLANIAEYANLKAAMQRKNVALTERLDQMNGEAINKANEIANLKADADALRNKLADTDAALGRANAEADRNASALKRLHIELCNAAQRANYAEWHPWLNLWAWVKRELGYAK